MRDDLKAKAQELASQQGVSLNSYINATLAATISQAETLAMMGDRLSNIDREQLHARVDARGFARCGILLRKPAAAVGDLEIAVDAAEFQRERVE